MMHSAMMAYIDVQCILDCLPVSVSTEPVYSDDQFADSYSNPYKLIYQCTGHARQVTDTVHKKFNFMISLGLIIV